jgi:hypothetical protein
MTTRPNAENRSRDMAMHDTSSDPKLHTAKLREEMRALITHLRHDVNQVSEPRAQALFETSAEVLEGLVKAYDDYDRGQETAFRR